jgi:NADH-quinone oxidoreductase subunit J
MILFYFFAFLLVLSALMVTFNKNPVYSILFLILSFFCSAGLLIIIGADFLAMLLLIVYVGAVAVLFLFVVMMLNINLAKLREGFVKHLSTGALVALVLLMDMYFIFDSADYEGFKLAKMDAAREIGKVLYTDYMLLFQICGAILLTAMIGAVVLTLRNGRRNKLQHRPTLRSSKDTLEIVKVKIGEGLGE